MKRAVSYVVSLIFTIQSIAQSGHSIPSLPDQKVKHSIILIGSTGYAPNTDIPENKLLPQLRNFIKDQSKKSSVIFLGDNIYPNGLPPETSDKRKRAESALNSQLELVRDYSGDTYFMPGNADWNNSENEGDEYIRRQEDYIENYYGQKSKVKFVPSNACAGPKIEKINKDLVFMFIDSEWWLRNDEYNATENEHCKCKTRHDLIEGLRRGLLKYRKERIVLFIHHPLQTLGKHSGTYDWAEHLFPLEKMVDGLYIPIPVIGSLSPAMNNIFGSKQDMSHPDYRLLIKEINSLIEELKLDLIVVSGHDHGLQYFANDSNHFILSGSGDPDNKLKITDDNDFVSNSVGYSIIRSYSNEETWLDFVEASNNTGTGKVIFRTQLYDSKKRLRRMASDITSFTGKTQDTIVSANSTYGGRGIKKFFFGNQYRDMWSTPVQVPFLDLSKIHGGLAPKKLGGGKTTISLRLKDSTDREYVLRSVDKYYYRALGKEYKDLKLFEVAQDMVGAHCTYAPLMMPYLSRIADIYYAEPSLYYVKHQPALKGYNQFLPEQLYWLEERTSVDATPSKNFGYAPKIINYMELMDNMENKKNHFVDQRWLLKSRLFDMWIHDFDRHHDNWRWAAFDKGDSTLYRPIPRDRDMVFYNFEGIIPSFVSNFIVRILLPFRHKIQDAQYFNDAARNVDNSFLNQLDWPDWEPIIAEFQNRLVDSVIHRSITLLPPEVQHLVAEEITEKLIYRRDHLRASAYEYYKLLNKEVVVVCSNDKDVVFINYLPNDKVEIRHLVKRKKKGDLLKYKRTFDPKVTKKIRLYGLDKSDEFIINGRPNRNIDIRIVGGHGRDTLLNHNNAPNVTLYDYPKDFILEGETEVIETNDLYINSYRRKENKYNTAHFSANLGIAPDDGFWIGIGQVRKIEEWPHLPHKARHQYSVSLAPGSRRFFHFNYSGRSYNLYRSDMDLKVSLGVNTPTYLNYFGLGNDTQIEAEERVFNWVRMHHYRMKAGLAYAWNEDKVKVELGSIFERRQVRLQEGRVTGSEQYEFTEIDFEAKHYLGLQGQISMGYRDNELNPMDGFEVILRLQELREVSDHRRSGYLSGKVISYIPLLRQPQVTLANQVSYDVAYGNPEFYQRPQLGHSSGLRGWRNQRFLGDRAFFHNIDLRVHLFNTYNHIMPMSVGLVSGFDYGRVWLKGESSGELHQSLSIGLSLALLNKVVMHPYYSIGADYNTINLQIGFRF